MIRGSAVMASGAAQQLQQEAKVLLLVRGQGGEGGVLGPAEELLQKMGLGLVAAHQVRHRPAAPGPGGALARPQPQQAPQAVQLPVLLLKEQPVPPAPAAEDAVGRPECSLALQPAAQLLLQGFEAVPRTRCQICFSTISSISTAPLQKCDNDHAGNAGDGVPCGFDGWPSPEKNMP